MRCLLNLVIPVNSVNELNKLLKSDDITVTIEKTKKPRSKESNSYFWTLCRDIAIKLKTTDHEQYHRLLNRYGHHEYVGVIKEAIPVLKLTFKFVEEKGPVMLGDVEGVRLKCTLGSSKYNQEQMSRLIDGTIQDCKELGIETLPPKEVERMIKMMEG